MSSKSSAFERWSEWWLLAQAWLLQLIAFALLLATLVGATSQFAGGSPLALLSGPQVKLDLGAIGACVQGSVRVCSARSTHPNYTAPYGLAQIPEPLLKSLPESLPDLPDLLVFVVTMSAVTTLLISIAVVPRCFAHRMSGTRIAILSKPLLKAGLVASTVTLVFGITVASCLRIYIGDAVGDFNTLAKALSLPWTAELGQSFGYMWASLVLIGLSGLAQIALLLTAPTPQAKMAGFQWA